MSEINRMRPSTSQYNIESTDIISIFRSSVVEVGNEFSESPSLLSNPYKGSQKINRIQLPNMSPLNHVQSTINTYQQPNAFKKPPSKMVSVAGPSRINEVGHLDQPVQNRTYSKVRSSDTGENIKVSMDGGRAITQGVAEIAVQDVSMKKAIPNSSSNTVLKNTDSQNSNNMAADTTNFNIKIFGSTESEKKYSYSLVPSKRVISWNKIFLNHFCYFEVIAAVISIQAGAIKSQRIMLLRDRKGPILQVVYYDTTHMDIKGFHLGQNLRYGSFNNLYRMAIE
ncbi:hypothetical protein NQ317_008689 [Molorchus minor]|uniref:Uncharacterized protein n=1 Tax=Molorchus minor TaxID=1323400 RepID=A0ABQ9K1G0_9CUCU|nr:hypothetical protein NQ317_008689 [Molorchus minor]